MTTKRQYINVVPQGGTEQQQPVQQPPAQVQSPSSNQHDSPSATSAPSPKSPHMAYANEQELPGATSPKSPHTGYANADDLPNTQSPKSPHTPYANEQQLPGATSPKSPHTGYANADALPDAKKDPGYSNANELPKGEADSGYSNEKQLPGGNSNSNNPPPKQEVKKQGRVYNETVNHHLLQKITPIKMDSSLDGGDKQNPEKKKAAQEARDKFFKLLGERGPVLPWPVVVKTAAEVYQPRDQNVLDLLKWFFYGTNPGPDISVDQVKDRWPWLDPVFPPDQYGHDVFRALDPICKDLNNDFFHGSLTDDQISGYLKSMGQWLFRTSDRDPGFFSVSSYLGAGTTRVRHWKIRKDSEYKYYIQNVNGKWDSLENLAKAFHDSSHLAASQATQNKYQSTTGEVYLHSGLKIPRKGTK